MQLLSDVHGRWDRCEPHPQAQLVLALGDMADGIGGIEWLASLGKPVVYVPGNHEYYGGDLGSRLDEMRARAVGTQVLIADRQTVTAGDVRFLCATLWTDHANLDVDLMGYSLKSLNDYRTISAKGWMEEPENQTLYLAILREFETGHPQHRGLFSPRPEKMNPLVGLALHQRALAYLTEELTKPWAGKTIVLTHHAPSLHSLLFGGYFTSPHVRRFGEALDRKAKPQKIGAYANSLEYLFSNHRIEMWLHGHLHEGLRYTINGTGVITNPTGYNDGQNQCYERSMLLLSTDPTRQAKLLCLTLYQSIQHQAAMGALLKKCLMSDDATSRPMFVSVEDVACFTQIYNHAIGPLLQQNSRDRNRPEFLLDPINLSQILNTHPEGGKSLSTARKLRFLHELLSRAVLNEKRSKDWLVALQSLPALRHWTVGGAL